MKSILIGAFVCLQLSTLLLAAPAAEQQSQYYCGPKDLTITVDNKILELYIDGTLVTPANADDWTKSDSVNVPGWGKVIAVKAEGFGVAAGILASTFLYVSDGSWKCTNTFSPGWEKLDFDASHWPAATVIGQNGVDPWGKIASIREDAYWIWTNNYAYGPNSDKVVYCRKHIQTWGSESCITSCVGQKDGNYQSCNGCGVYATCSNGILYDNRPCPASELPDPLQWDDRLKACRRSSYTCWECSQPLPCLGRDTGTRCRKHCAHMQNGEYQSCNGCHVYASCIDGYLFDNRPCGKKSDGSQLVWDENLKRCEYTSSTCTECL